MKILLPLLVALGVSFPAVTFSQDKTEIWISPEGVDNNPGTRERPFGSLNMALRRARELRRTNDSAAGIHIVARGGVYHFDCPQLLRAEDSGTETSPTIIEAAPDEHPVFSGAVSVTGWKKASSNKRLPRARASKVWVADAPLIDGRPLELRQLWVNDVKAVRARQPNGDSLDRLLVWDRTNQLAWIPSKTLGDLRDPTGVEIVFHQQWEIAICRLQSLQVQGDRARLTLQSPEGPIQFAHPWPQPVMSTNGNAPFYLVNALEFLDQPGEWYQESSSGRIYYWPRPDEEISRARVMAPVLETLLQIEGTLDQPIVDVQFRNISFAHTSWLRPSHSGHVPLQAGMFLLDAYKLSPKGTVYQKSLDNQAWIGRPPAAVSVRNAGNVRFDGCRFEHLASAGLDFESGTHDDTVEGCVFRDIGGNGIQWGKFSDPGIETHRPYNPSDAREICTRERIANNLVTDCANEDWGCVGICVGYGREIAIEHNDVGNVSYTGISLGWGWNPSTNCMRDNRIVGNHVHHVATRMCDTAGIYALSAQPGTVIRANAIHDIHMSPYVFNPQHWFYLYLDEGSSGITVRDNWCPAEKFLKNAVGPNNVWENNGPMVSPEIKDAAGLEPAFKKLLSEIK